MTSWASPAVTSARNAGDAGAAAVFACCGTGEFHALSPDEFRLCVEAAVEESAGEVPVLAGTGYGTALAVRYARIAEDAGADGLLAMPPYLVVAGQDGLVRHYTALAAATALDVIVYQRDNAVFTPRTVVGLARVERIIGLKDGHGDLDLMQRIVSAVRAEVPERDFCTSTGCPPPSSRSPPTAPSASPSTPPPSSPSPPTSRSPSTGPWRTATTRP